MKQEVIWRGCLSLNDNEITSKWVLREDKETAEKSFQLSTDEDIGQMLTSWLMFPIRMYSWNSDDKKILDLTEKLQINNRVQIV